MASLRITPRHLFRFSSHFSRILSTDASKRVEIKRSPERVLTVPNILTLTRIAATPAIGYFIWNGMHSQALACFALAATTDLLDGYIARKFNQNSDLGAILDPIADKFLLTTCFVAMYNTDLMPLWLVKGFIARDLVLVSGGACLRYYGFGEEKPGLKKFLDFKNHPTLGFEPTLVSKCNTALQCLLIVLHLSSQYIGGIPNYSLALDCLHYTAAFTTCFSFAQYMNRAFTPNWMAKVPRSKSDARRGI